jgi:hypothetical protein
MTFEIISKSSLGLNEYLYGIARASLCQAQFILLFLLLFTNRRNKELSYPAGGTDEQEQ